MTQDAGEKGTLEWTALDRSDWPEYRSPDFGGLWPDGSPLMQAVCPGCGLYRENDDSPADHFDDGGPCPWAAARRTFDV